MGTLKLNVNLVDLFFTVKDKAGNLVPHLTKDDCSISEDKVPQKLKNFAAETHLPLTLGILLDTSGSQQAVLPLEQEAGSEFLTRSRSLTETVRLRCRLPPSRSSPAAKV